MKFKAYSLLEISINLTIIGITIGMLFPLFHLIQNQYAKNNNTYKQEYIRIKMQDYLLKHGHLPYAGDEKGNEIDNLLSGFIPYKALDMKYENTFNHKKKKFKYCVNKKFVKPEENIILLPIHYPTSIVFNKNIRTFARYYNYQNNELHYDLNIFQDSIIILNEDNENIIKNNFFYAAEPIKLDEKEVLPIRKKLDYYGINGIEHLQSAYLMIKKLKTTKNEKYIVYNSIAWVVTVNEAELIDSKYVFKYNYKNNNILYQTKFDMLSQCGYPCTNESIILY